MRHYDPTDPIWTENADRQCALTEAVEEWQDAIDAEWDSECDSDTTTVVGVERDEGSIVLFRTSEGPFLAVSHTVAPLLMLALQADGEVPVQRSAWAVL